jgi:amino acid permease
VGKNVFIKVLIMSESKKKISVLDASLLLTGNMIGAGILALL